MPDHEPDLPADAYYLPLPVPTTADPGFEYFQPTAGTVSVWSADIQHGGPPSGLMVRSLARAAGDDGKHFTRVTTEILGGIGLGVNRVRTQLVRPGARIAQWQADLEVQQPSGEFRPVARTVAWRIVTGDTAPVRSVPAPPLPATPEELHPITGFPETGGDAVPWGRVGFIGTTITAHQPGRNGVTPALWIKPAIPLVAGEEMSNLESVFTVLDVANGVGTQLDPTKWSWMNMDTTVHLVGQPTSPWLGLDGDLAIGSNGYGASFCDLYDVTGFLGRSAQTDMIAPV